MIAGKVAVVTGAGDGVGRETAVALARHGVAVGLIGRTLGSLEETARIVEQQGGSASVAAADVGDEAAVETAMAALTHAFGGVDILVCAAAVGLYGKVKDYSLADWNRTLATNLTGVFLCCRAVLPAMTARGSGAIVTIGSGAGKQGYADLAAYSASKFGLLGLMQSLAAEVAGSGVKVSTVVPGSILTGFGDRPLAEKERLRAEGRKYLLPADVAEAIRFLLEQSDRAWTQELNLWPF